MANLTIRLDTNDKEEFSSICEKIGLTVSAAFSVFVKAVIHEQKIPFELSAQNDNFYSKENIQFLEHLKHLDDEGNLKFSKHNIDEINRMAE